MVSWNDLHPYNAVHSVQLPGRLDEPRLRQVIRETVEARGLTGLEWSRATATYSYHGGPAQPTIETLAAPAQPMQALCHEMQRQLNTPFLTATHFDPFRFFLVPADCSFYVGLVYCHPIADASSIVLLLRELCARYRGTAPAPAPPLDLYPDGGSGLLGRHSRVLLRRLLALPRHLWNVRHWHRPPCRDPGDFTNRLEVFPAESSLLDALIATAASWSLTVNDLLLALFLESLSSLALQRARARRRRALAVGCIVNLRHDLGLDSRQTFGLFLGSFTVTHAVPEGMLLRDLAEGVHRQTRLQKRHRLYLGTPLELGMGRLALRFFSPDRRRIFYQKHYPLWGGITNMNLNTLWEPSAEGAPMDYVRAVSTGPATPLVLSVSTVGRRANIGLSYRQAVFSTEQIATFKTRFLERWAQLDGRRML
jgi:hypothetical protein